MLGPIVFGSISLVIGAISFWGRSRLSHMGAKLSSAVNENINYEEAYRRRLRYGYVSGLIFLSVGAGFLIFGVVNLLTNTG
ncbi:hypothetical protein ABIC98_003262 [Arthrobacter nitrophenolicus]|uniref:Uncharacterized protein n=1 Tax=Arthrobacter nitrophenolicus TaxID=683150 RepID=A0ACC6TIL6_9MICC